MVAVRFRCTRQPHIYALSTSLVGTPVLVFAGTYAKDMSIYHSLETLAVCVVERFPEVIFPAGASLFPRGGAYPAIKRHRLITLEFGAG